MAQITWRDVATPDFGSASQSFNNFSKLFGDGIAGLKGAVGGFDQAKSDAAQKQFDLALAQMTDAEDIRKAVAGGQVGGLNLNDPNVQRRLDFTAINPTAMTALGSSQVKLGQDRIDASQRSVRDDQAEIFATANQLSRAGKFDEAEKVRAGANYEGFGYGAVDLLNRSVQGTESAQTGNDQAVFNLGNQRTEQSDKAAVATAMSVVRAGAMTADDARLMLNDPEGPMAGLSPMARAAAEAQMANEFPGLFGSGGAGGASGAIAAAAGGMPTGGGSSGAGGAFALDVPQKAVAKTLQTGGLPPTVVAGFLGNFHVEGGYGGAKGDGGSASGIAQWRNERRANFKSQFGKEPHDASAEEQAKFVLWEMENPGKAGMSVAQRDAILAAKTPEEAAELIDKHFERSDGQHRSRRVGAATTAAQLMAGSREAQTQITTRAMQDGSHGLNIDFATTIADNRDVGQVADGLREGVFKGTSRAFLLNNLSKVMQEGNVNAATAAAVLTRNLTGSDENFWSPRQLLRQLTLGSTPNLGNGGRLNDKGVKADIKLLGKMMKGNGQAILSQVAARNNLADLSGQIQAATANLAAAQQEYQAALVRLPTQPGLKASMPLKLAKVEAAKQQVMMLQAQSQNPSAQPQ